jgi:hypothetical protein
MSNPAILTYNDALFRQQIPEYSDLVEYPMSVLQNWWNIAINYVSDVGNFGSLNGTSRQYAINLMMAHLIYISNLTEGGTVPYVLSASSIDKVSITAVPPPLKNQWGWWMSISSYGQQLWALLQMKSVGGFYIGGFPNLAAFRR